VALRAPDGEALEQLSKKLAEAAVDHVRVVESDAPYEGALMALGVKPARKEALRRFFSSLPLFK
jgi:hypothetical protein